MSDHANPASDILPRSVWMDADDVRVIVLSTAGGYVRFHALGAPVLMHHFAFRRLYQPLYDRRAMKSQFSMTCANLGEFRAYWFGDPGRFLARSVSCQRKFAIPANAVEIGLYAAPFNPDAFLADLDCTLATLDRQSARATASGTR